MRYFPSLVLVLCLSSLGTAADIDLGAALTVAPGGAAPLPVQLAAPAPPGGVTVTLTSSDTAKATISPDAVYVPAGLTVPFGLPRVLGGTFGQATISASAFGLTGGSVSVQVSATLSVPPSLTLQRGSSTSIFAALQFATPSAITLNVSSTNPAVAGVPATASIPAGATNAGVTISALSAGTSLIHISSLPNIADSTIFVTVFAPGAITLSPVSLTLGQSLPFPVALGSPAGQGGVTVQLASSSPNTVTIQPTSVYIPAGQTVPSAQPEILGGDIGVSTLSASAPGYQTATQQVPVTASITMSPSTLTIPVGGSQILSMILSAAAPSIGVPITGDRAANGFVNGLTVFLSSSDPRIAAVQPSVQFYGDGSSITTVVVVISGISPGTAVIRAGVPPYLPDAVATIIVGSGGTAPASLVPAGGGAQTAQVNTPFGIPLSVRALDNNSNPVSGVAVTFSAPSSGASAAFAGGVNTALTDASGLATSPTLTANGIAGMYSVTASAAGVAIPATFALTNTAASSGAIILPTGLSLSPGQSVPLSLTLTVPAPSPNGVTVTLTSADPSKAVISPGTVTIPAGSSAPLTPPTLTGVNFGSVSISASASGYASASQLAQVGATLSFSPASLTINGLVTQSVNLNLSAPAPSTGLAVSLSSSNPQAVTVPGSVSFTPNTTSVSVPALGVGPGFATIQATASAPNISGASASVTVVPPSGISLASGVKVSPGEWVSLPVSLTSPAGPGGVALTLTSSNPSILNVSPANLYFPQGATTPYSLPLVNGVNLGTAMVTASANGLGSATASVQVAGRLSGPPAITVQRGSTTYVTFVLSWPVPSPLTLTVSSDAPGIASVPASVTIPANQSSAVVPITGLLGGATTIRIGAAPDITESTVSVTVQSSGNLSMSIGTPPALGQSVAISITLGAPAPAGGLVISLATSDANTVGVAPTSVFVPAGATAPSVSPVATGHNIGLATITASAPGYLNATVQVPVTATITMSPQTLVIPTGESRLIALALSSSAPSSGPITPDRAAGGYVPGMTVQLGSSNTAVAQVQPSVQFYPDGSSITVIVVVVNGVSPGTAVIHANALPFIPDVTTTVIVQ